MPDKNRTIAADLSRPEPKYIDMTPTWGEIGCVAGRIMLSREWDALRKLWPEVARAFAAAEALKIVLPEMPPDIRRVVNNAIQHEMRRQMVQLPSLPWHIDKPEPKEVPVPPRLIAWKTGRLYTEHGQRMAALLHEDGGILFVDIDRNISGYLTPEFCEENNVTLTTEKVLWAYDWHEKSKYWFHVHEERFIQGLLLLKAEAKKL